MPYLRVIDDSSEEHNKPDRNEPKIDEFVRDNILVKSALLEDAKKFMKNYRLPFGVVDMDNEDTGAVVAVILYFIAYEPTICHQKIEYYLLLLNFVCLKDTGKYLFDWKLNANGRINKFKKILQFMLSKKLLFKNGVSQFYILSGASDILRNLPRIFFTIEYWLMAILNKCGRKNAREMFEFLQELGIIGDCNICDDFIEVDVIEDNSHMSANSRALENIRHVMKKHLAEHDSGNTF